jgi:hypothetical protein
LFYFHREIVTFQEFIAWIIDTQPDDMDA